MIQKFRKKPVVIEALKWSNNHREMFDFLTWDEWNKASMTAIGKHFYIDHSKVQGGLVIRTLEGEHIATIGDYIIKGVAGEFYPCKPEIFVQTYEPLQPPEPAASVQSAGAWKLVDKDFKEKDHPNLTLRWTTTKGPDGWFQKTHWLDLSETPQPQGEGWTDEMVKDFVNNWIGDWCDADTIAAYKVSKKQSGQASNNSSN